MYQMPSMAYAPINPETGKRYTKQRQAGFGVQWYDDPATDTNPLTAPIDSSKMRGAYDQANTQMQDFLKQEQPQFQAAQYAGPGENRFESELSASQKRMNSLLDDPSSIQQSAAYKFRLGQGEQALQRQLAAKGMLGSGNRLQELTKYGQDMASQEYENQATRLQNLLSGNQQAWNQAQGTNVQEALGKYSTGMQGALGSYGTAMQGHTARGNTLADLLKTGQAGLLGSQELGLKQQSLAQDKYPTTSRGGFSMMTRGW